MKLVIFDDNKWSDFFPLTLNRSVGDLRVGILKLRQRIAAYMEFEKYSIIVSESLGELYNSRFSDREINLISKGNCLFVNSRIKINDAVVKTIKNLKDNSFLYFNDEIVAFKFRNESADLRVNMESLSGLYKNFSGIKLDADFWSYPWDLITANCDMIKQDFEDFFYEKDNFFETEPGVTILNPYNVWLGEDVELKPGVVIDASEGPVVIDENAKVMPNAVIIGPTYIGKNSVIKVGAKIYEGTSIGPVCKIGGEVEETIIQGYTNKQHDGFLGNSYLGEWVNLGADTNNSDLKNNYKNVKMYNYNQKKQIDTNCQFLGTLIGDHSKTGINSTINTGCVIGLGCNLFGRDTISGFIPSFSWGEALSLDKYKKEAFFATADKVKKRRSCAFNDVEKELYNKINT